MILKFINGFHILNTTCCPEKIKMKFELLPKSANHVVFLAICRQPTKKSDRNLPIKSMSKIYCRKSLQSSFFDI